MNSKSKLIYRKLYIPHVSQDHCMHMNIQQRRGNLFWSCICNHFNAAINYILSSTYKFIIEYNMASLYFISKMLNKINDVMDKPF